jgi:catechol 2,3-dioxygenase-like lactoylglutathione lyase family enzyme
MREDNGGQWDHARKEPDMARVKRLQHTSVPMPPGGEETARDFYGTVLGMPEIPRPEGLAGMRLVWFAANEEGDEVHVFTDEGWESNSAAQHLCLEVDDLSDFERRLSEADYKVDIPETIHNRPRLFTRDPFNNLIELVQILGPYR